MTIGKNTNNGVSCIVSQISIGLIIMTELEAIGKKILEKTSIKPDQKFGSVIALLMVISICFTAIRVIQECNKNKTKTLHGNDLSSFYQEQFRSIGLRKSWYTSLKLKKIIRQKMNAIDYQKYKNELKDAILEVSVNLSKKETQILMEAMSND